LKHGAFDESTQKEIKKMWDKLDQDGNGFLDGVEAQIFFENTYDWLSPPGKEKKKNITPEERQLKKKQVVCEWLTAFDSDHDGTIDWQEFMTGLTRLLQTEVSNAK